MSIPATTSLLKTSTQQIAPQELTWAWVAMGAALLSMGAFFSQDLLSLVERWVTDPGWGHGFVVPLIAAYFIFVKWETLIRLKPRGSLWGLAILLLGIVGQTLFRVTGEAPMSPLSVLVVLFGLGLFVLGWEAMKILWLPIAYLGFALPPPQQLYVRLTMPMQEIAAELGIQMLPLFGGEGTRSGTVIDVTFGAAHTQLFVAEACSGMKMLTAFFALSVALAYSSTRPIWQKLTLALLALPIAIVCNAFRVALTGVLAVKVDPSLATGNQHIYIGFVAMLIPAALLQLGVAWILDRIFIEAPDGKAPRTA